MLKGINPRLNADMLQALAAMGYADDPVIVGTKIPADSVAR
jgi:L-fucose mutarotase